MKSMQLLVTSSPFDGTQLCVDYNTDIFFPEDYEPDSVALAKSICNDCWIKNKCLAFAISTNEKEGVWGGATPNERRNIKRRARR